MKKSFRKLISVVLVVLMVFSLATPAFAAEETAASQAAVVRPSIKLDKTSYEDDEEVKITVETVNSGDEEVEVVLEFKTSPFISMTEKTDEIGVIAAKGKTTTTYSAVAGGTGLFEFVGAMKAVKIVFGYVIPALYKFFTLFQHDTACQLVSVGDAAAVVVVKANSTTPEIPEDPEDPEISETPTIPEEPSTSDTPETPDDQEIYTVTFNLNYESAATIPDQTVVAGEAVVEPEAPEREGYIFTGWYIDASASMQFLFDEAIDSDITLFANWIEYNRDSAYLQYILDSTWIKYNGGDYSEHITQNIEFCCDFEVDDITTVVWSSNHPEIISDEGIVNRPTNTDSAVDITVTISKNDITLSDTFNVLVIHEPNRPISESNNYSVMDIVQMTDGEAKIEYNDSETQVLSIDGCFSTLEINNSDDALDAVYDIRTILGLNNPYNELTNTQINRSACGNKYIFDQYYNGYKVYGRSVMLSADSLLKTDLLYSSVYKSSDLDSFDFSVNVSVDDAIANASADYTDCTTEFKETVIYCEKETPYLTYVINVIGKDSEENSIDINVFMDAKTGNIINSEDNMITATGSGKTEKGTKVSFPVEFEWLDWKFFYMEDSTRNIQMYDDKFGTGNFYRICSEFNVWTDKSAISAYTNAIKVYDFYKNNLSRDSYDDNNGKLNIAVNVASLHNNAASSSWGLGIGTSNGSITYASCLDVMGHEFTHSVFRTSAVSFSTSYDHNYIGTINEGYADIFGCLIEGDWTLSEDLSAIRSASNPHNHNCPKEVGGTYYLDPTNTANDANTAAHNNSTILSHAAYLMNSYGIPISKLDNLWYESMLLSYDITSNFSRVRRNVIDAAEKLGMTNSEIAIIKKAFDEVKIYGDRASIEFEINGSMNGLLPVSNALIQVYRNSELVASATTNNGYYKIENLELGVYKITVTADNYIPYEKTFALTKADELIKEKINLVSSGVGMLHGTVVSATTGMTVPSATVNIRSGYGNQTGDIIATITSDSSGKFILNLNAGYYTIETICSGYTTSYSNTEISGSSIITKRITISPSMQSNSYRVVLTWGSSPSDLDSHLVGKSDDGSSYHLYYSNKNVYKANGTKVGNLDVDDTTGYGPETVTFTIDTEGSYEYYVYRYSSSGNMPKSNANVKVYNGDILIGDYKIDASANSSYRYWNIFKIENGIYKTVNTVTSSR